MKHLLLSLLALTFLGACGKENKSGKKEWSYTDPYLGNVTNAPANISALLQTIPCMTGMGANTSRQQMQLPLEGFSTVIPSGQIHVGITSYGDVGVVYGQGGGTPTFIAYLCQRSFTNYQGSRLSNVRLGSYSNCNHKPLASATLVFPGSSMGIPAVTAEFRMLDFGYNNGGSLVKIPGVCR